MYILVNIYPCTRGIIVNIYSFMVIHGPTRGGSYIPQHLKLWSFAEQHTLLYIHPDSHLLLHELSGSVREMEGIEENNYYPTCLAFKSCGRCTEHGYKPMGGGICFKESDYTKLKKRTNRSFRDRRDPEHHSGQNFFN